MTPPCSLRCCVRATACTLSGVLEPAAASLREPTAPVTRTDDDALRATVVRPPATRRCRCRAMPVIWNGPDRVAGGGCFRLCLRDDGDGRPGSASPWGSRPFPGSSGGGLGRGGWWQHERPTARATNTAEIPRTSTCILSHAPQGGREFRNCWREWARVRIISPPSRRPVTFTVGSPRSQGPEARPELRSLRVRSRTRVPPECRSRAPRTTDTVPMIMPLTAHPYLWAPAPGPRRTSEVATTVAAVVIQIGEPLWSFDRLQLGLPCS